MKNRRYTLLFLFVMFNGLVQGQQHDSIAVKQAAERFVKAFNTFDWLTFKSCFTDDASMFHPTWEQARRRQGRKEIEATWLEVFPEFVDSTNKERLSITPRDLHVQLYDDAAVLTFHLGEGVTQLSRRSLFMVKQKGVWKIAHLHASSLKGEAKNK
jgi:ketosteroid isomerase-like protein